jgi:PAS domain S-box-containing protein
MVILNSQVSIAPVRDKAVMAAGTAREQLVQKRIRELRENTDFVSTLLESLVGYAIIAADFEGNIIAYNEGARQIYGYAPEEVIGKQGIDILFPRQFVEAKELQQIVNGLMEKGRFSCEGENVKKNGESFPARILFTLTRDKSGKVIGFVEIVEDLTERQQAEHTLKYSEVKYRRLFEAAQDGILILDADTGKIVDVNPFLTDMLGYPCEELLGKELWEIGPFKDIEASREAFQELQRQGYVRYENLPLEKKSGQQISVEFISNVYMVNNNKVIQCNIRDITRRVQMKEELRESEAHYRELAESISDVFFGLDEDLRYTYWNQASEKLTGIPARDALGKRLYDIFPNSEQTRMAEKAYKKALRTGKPQHFVNEYPLQGKVFSFEISAYPSKSGLSVFFKDVTKSRRIKKRLWDSMSNFYKVINDDPDGIIITNRKGIVRYVNPAAESLFGRKSEDFIGEQFGFPITPSDVREVGITRQSGETVVAEMRVVETVWYDEISYLISLHDISERKQAHQEQEKLSQQLQAKVSELETFSYGIAHDLRSPMVSIEGFSRLLLEDIQDQKVENVQEDIRLLESGVRKMQDFLNSTLEYSRAGHLLKRTRNVSFSEIVNEVITEFKEQISSMGATVATAKTFPRVYVDRAMIVQVLADLIQNSIKYRDKTVPLKIEIGHYLSENETVFFVRDNGPGIDASEAEKVFALFYRGTMEGEGSGIGLTIVKKIIEAHGGRIWVQQGQPLKGTTMCFTLPQQSDTKKVDTNGKDQDTSRR